MCISNYFSFYVLCFENNFFFFFNDTATTEIYTLSLHDALPNSPVTAGPATTAAQPSSPLLTTPSLLGGSPSGTGALDVFSQLGLAPGDVVANALTNVGSVSNILADQLNQVAQLTNSMLDNLMGPLGPGAQTLSTPVNELTNGVIRG